MNPKIEGVVLVAVALLAGLYVVLKPAPETPPSSPAATVRAPAVPPAPEELAVELVVRDGKRVSGPELIQARLGQVLRLRVESNRADELHLHGYDIEVPLQAGAAAELRLPLSLSGRFEIELHHAHGTLAVLEVQPKQN